MEEQKQLLLTPPDVDIDKDFKTFVGATDDFEKMFDGTLSWEDSKKIFQTISELGLYKLMKQKYSGGVNHLLKEEKEVLGNEERMVNVFLEIYLEIKKIITEEAKNRFHLEQNKVNVMARIETAIGERKFDVSSNPEKLFEDMKKPGIKENKDFSLKMWMLFECLPGIIVLYTQKKTEMK